MTVFADASFYIAALSPRDALHAAARRIGDSYTGQVATTEYVLLEVAGYLSSANVRAEFVALVAALRADPQTEIVPSSAALWEQGFQLYSRRPDKD